MNKLWESFKKFVAMVTVWQVVFALMVPVFMIPSYASAATVQNSPTAHSDGYNTHDFSNGDRAFTNNDEGAQAEHDDADELYYNYGFNIPAGSTISKVNVMTRAKRSSDMSGAHLHVSVSWNGGTNWSSSVSCGNLTTSYANYYCNDGNWGRTWTSSELSNANFKVRVRTDYSGSWSSKKIWLDWIPVTVEYTAPITYSVSYNGNGNTGGSVPTDPSSPYIAGSMVTVLDNTGGLTKTGYTFNGWNTQANGGGTDRAVSSTFTMPSSAVILYAKWTINSYTITFDSNGGTVVAPITQNYNTAVTAPADPTRTGYTFTGWTPAVPATMPAYNQTLVAGWNINSYTVSFEPNGGTPDPFDQIINYGGFVSEPTDPAKTGYTFNAWYKEIGLSNVWNFVVDTVINNITLYAGWTINSYTVSFEPNGGTPDPPNQTVNYGGFVSEPTDPTKTGYTFGGWYEDVALTNPWVFGSETVAGNMTLYAKWTINSYTITFDSNGGTPVSPITQNYGTAVTPPANPTRTGYTFTGWTPSLPATMPAYNQTLVAEWEINEYIVTTSVTGSGNVTGGGTYDYGDDVALTATPGTGYHFVNWAGDCSGTTNTYNINDIDSNWSCTANFAINQYTVAFDSNGGTSVSDQNVNHGGLVSEPTDPTKVGFEFVGWYEDSGLTTLWNFSSDAVTGNMTLYAKWEELYTAIFDSNGGSAVLAQTSLHAGDLVSEPSSPSKTGYVFDGWYEDSGLTTIWNFATDTITGNMTLYAKWQINTYTVTFVSNGGSAVSPVDVNYENLVPKPGDPNRNGYSFGAWYKDPGLTIPWNFDTDTVTQNLTLYAGWNALPVSPPIPPIVLTPPIVIPVAAAAAPAAVLGTTSEPVAQNTQQPEVKGSEDNGVKGSSETICPWWWIIGIILLAALAFTGGVVKAEKDESKIRKYYYVWPVLYGAVAWIAHYYLHQGYKATWFCDNYWLLVIVIAAIAEIVYRLLVKKRDEENR